jgi:hypothetical protein
VEWTSRVAPPAIGADGVIDYGNIDTFEINDAYTLDGSWGRMVVRTPDQPELMYLEA